jgi:phosphopantothenoylcysteine synthetase/decarboxylase
MARVILGVGGGIAAYKACELLRLFKENGHSVRVVPTPDALRFVGEPTWAALSGEPVTADVWTGVSDVPHVKLGQTADLVFVAPATADLLARATAGMSSDLLTATLLTARCPVAYAPAMHTEMWEHPATQHNVATLRARGAIVVEPAVGRLTGKDTAGAASRTRRPCSSSRKRSSNQERTSLVFLPGFLGPKGRLMSGTASSPSLTRIPAPLSRGWTAGRKPHPFVVTAFLSRASGC